jgi:hypothetical protein
VVPRGRHRGRFRRRLISIHPPQFKNILTTDWTDQTDPFSFRLIRG